MIDPTPILALFVVVAASYLLATAIKEVIAAFASHRRPRPEPDKLTPEAIQHLAESAKDWP